MGIINQGILGGFSGKVGPIVGCHWKSKYYIRAHAPKSAIHVQRNNRNSGVNLQQHSAF